MLTGLSCEVLNYFENEERVLKVAGQLDYSVLHGYTFLYIGEL